MSLVTAADQELLAAIQRLLPSPLEQVAVDGFAADHSEQSGAPSRFQRGRRGPAAGRRPLSRSGAPAARRREAGSRPSYAVREGR